jgi:hypothetical protein
LYIREKYSQFLSYCRPVHLAFIVPNIIWRHLGFNAYCDLHICLCAELIQESIFWSTKVKIEVCEIIESTYHTVFRTGNF